MQASIECIIVGGPQHGTVSRCTWFGDAILPALPTSDGLLCAAAARRRDDFGIRYLLLHPRATGEQFLTMLAT